MNIESIFEEINEERLNQEEKWGQQEHPMLDPVLLKRKGGCTPWRMCEEYEIPSESRAKNLTDIRAREGQLTYFHILQEEVSEAVCALNDYESMRKELVQVAAVTVAMIQTLDRNGR
ncbi:MAG: hypothetical protein ACJAVX_002420 [Pseudoalteromonas rhizosphaerae]|jgi:hypothetical protein|uniref:hypothetical protein n=1 Tax=Pseudoalteromonas rhizosphaerae TaxID=2518973 RepID=UPI0039E620AA